MSDDFELDTNELARQLAYSASDLPSTEEQDGVSRRELLKRGAVGAAAVAGLGGLGSLAGSAAAATSKTGAFTGTLRVITLGVEFPTPEVAQRIKQDLGFDVALTATDPVTMLQKAITAPETFDIFGGYNYSTLPAWSTHNLLPIDTTKITGLASALQAVRLGKGQPGLEGDLRRRRRPVPGNVPQAGDERAAAHQGRRRRVNKDIVQWIDESTGKPYSGQPMPRYIIGTPAHFNADSVGYNADVITKQPNQVGWQELLNKKWQGKVALLKDPGIVMQDIGNALKALGIFKPKDMGNMTVAEIDRVVKVATTYKKAGQFRAYWANFNESVNLMASKEVVDRVDVVAGRGAARRAGHQRQVRGSAHGLPRLVQPKRHRGARRERTPPSCRPATTT